MHMPPPSAADTAKAVELGHEPSTVSVKGVTWFFVVFFAFAVVVHVAVWVVYRELVKYQESQNVERSAVASTENHPPEPLLQPTRRWHEYTEPDDLALMHGRENLEFVRRGWIDRESGEFKIPDDVINSVATSGGAPSAAPSSNPASGGTGAGMPR